MIYCDSEIVISDKIFLRWKVIRSSRKTSYNLGFRENFPEDLNFNTNTQRMNGIWLCEDKVKAGKPQV